MTKYFNTITVADKLGWEAFRFLIPIDTMLYELLSCEYYIAWICDSKTMDTPISLTIDIDHVNFELTLYNCGTEKGYYRWERIECLNEFG